MQFPHAKILVFCKAPVAGNVKTRLAESIGELAAVEIHKYLTHHCLQQLVDFKLAPVELWCAPDASHDFFIRCQSDFDISLKQQVGEDLGQRMQHALRETLNQHSSAILIGTDCPGFSKSYYLSALLATSKNKTAIGPAEDGGYVLLATSTQQSDIFTNMPWGTSMVYANTLSRLKGEVEVLSPLWDVDYIEDLERLRDSANTLHLDCKFQAYVDSLNLV